MATRSFAYHAHGTADSDKSCCYAWFVCHDKTLEQQCMLAQARPPMRNHFTSIVFNVHCLILCSLSSDKLVACAHSTLMSDVRLIFMSICR